MASLRLPKQVVDAVRAAAEVRRMRPTALMRVVERAAAGERVIPVSAVLAFLAETAARHPARRPS